MHPATAPMSTPSDRALLERALIAVEQVLAHANSANAPVVAGTPANEAIGMCLTAAAALVDVAQALMRQPAEEAAEPLTQEWQAIIGHTKSASRTAHQAVLVLSSQRNLVTAQGGVLVGH